MGLGASLAFIAIGAILAFALRVELSGVDIQTVGWILILVGLIGMAFTLMYTRPRQRNAVVADVVEEEPLYVVQSEEPVAHVHEPAPHVHEPPPAPHVHERVVEEPPVAPHVHTERAAPAAPATPSAPTPTEPVMPMPTPPPQPGRHIEQGRQP
jgi:uncharacterized protein DUF6458